jgi:phage tail-like protein
MPNAARDDPHPAFNFLVQIDGVVVAGFEECSGLSSQTDVIEYREGGDRTRSARKIPGLTRWSPIVLRRGVSTHRELWQWRRAIVDGQLDRRAGAIVLLGHDRSEVARWVFREGWPSKWEGPHLRARSSEVAIETLEIVHEGLELE